MKSTKCTLCTDLAEGIGEPHPVCAKACPQRALVFGDIEELRATYGDNCTIGIFGDETEPNVVIAPSRFAELGGELMNPAEVGQMELAHR